VQFFGHNSSTEATVIMSGSTTPEVPADFLQAPAENITVSRIDFKQGGLPMYDGLYAVVLDDVLTPDEVGVTDGRHT